MDIESESFEPQQSQVQVQQHSQQQQHLQCEQTKMLQQNVHSADEFVHMQHAMVATGPHMSHMPMELPIQTAIPLPAPPSLMTTNTTPTTTGAAPASPMIQPLSSDIDIDSLLLQQFSCLGTTDHEDLINQFQSLMNNEINKESARFFLEMSNWNLQTAVGCYLDYCNFQTLPSMKIVERTNSNEQRQAWRLLNDGTEDWPSGCYLTSPSQIRRIQIPVIRPGNTCDITADITPNHPAIMWRLCTPNGWYFGETIWMIPPGSSDTAADLAERMSQLRTNTISPENFPQVNVVITVNME